MKQYKYFHHPTKNYMDIISDNNPTDKARHLKIFEGLKDYKPNNRSWRFTYVIQNDEVYFLQNNSSDQTFCQGFVGDIEDIQGLPAEYINMFETGYTDSDLNGISDKNLPRRGEFDLSLAKGLKPIFGKLVDAVIYSTKPIIIMGDNVDILAKYVKVLSQLFPAHYAKKITFSIGGADIPKSIIANINESNVKVFALTSDVFNRYSNYFNCFVISDKMGVKDNYNSELHFYSNTIDSLQGDLSIGNTMKAKRLLKFACGAFTPDGQINDKELKCIVVLNDFEMNQTIANAKNLLLSKYENPDFYFDINSIVQAIEIILNDPLSKEEDLELIDKLRKSDSNLHDVSLNLYLEFILQKINKNPNYVLSSYQKEEIITKINSIADNDYDQNQFVKRLCAKPYKNHIYLLLCEAYLLKHKNTVLKSVINYYAQALNMKIELQVECFNNLLKLSKGDEDTEKLFFAAYLCSCFFEEVPKVQRGLRLQAFKEVYTAKKLNPIELVKYIIDIKNRISFCVTNVCHLSINSGLDDFSFLPEEWLNDIVSKLTLEECLDLFIKNDTHNVSDYEDLHIRIKEKCLVLEDVKRAVNKDYELMKKYKKFLLKTHISKEEEQPFREYFATVESQANLSNDLQKFRTDFVLASYKNSSKSKQKELRDSFRFQCPDLKNFEWYNPKEDFIEKILELDLNISKNRRIAQHLVNFLSNQFKKYKNDINFYQGGNKPYFVYASIQGIMLFLVSVLIMLLPPIIKSALIGTSFYKEYLSYFRFYYLVICFYTYVLYMISYIRAFVNVKVKDKNICKKIAFKNTILYALIPMIVFVIIYFVFYIFVNQWL